MFLIKLFPGYWRIIRLASPDCSRCNRDTSRFKAFRSSKTECSQVTYLCAFNLYLLAPTSLVPSSGLNIYREAIPVKMW